MESKVIQYIICGGLVAILLWTLTAAWRNGQSKAQSTLAVKNSVALQQALAYFSSDQNRYPTEQEFSSAQVMGIYLSAFPPAQPASKQCSHIFDYKNPDPKTYKLYVCLPYAVGNLQAGLNQLTP